MRACRCRYNNHDKFVSKTGTDQVINLHIYPRHNQKKHPIMKKHQKDQLAAYRVIFFKLDFLYSFFLRFFALSVILYFLL